MPTIITLAELVTPSTVDDALALELSIATQLNLPITSWQPLDPSRTIFQINANLVALESQTIAQIAQGGFASYAALMPAGASALNDGAGFSTTWMDLCGTQFFNVGRIQASAAAGLIPIINTTATTQTYSAGQLHFQHPTSGATYTNTASGTIPPGASSVLVAADPAFVGPVGTLSPGQIAIMLSPFPGVSPVAQVGGLVGSAIETNAHYLARCQLKLGTLSPMGPASAYEFVAQSLPVFGTTLDDGTLFTQPTPAHPYGVIAPVTRVNAFVLVGSGIVNVFAADAAGGLAGCAQLTVSNVTWSAGVATVTTIAPHGLAPGNFVILNGVQGATGVNNPVAAAPAWLVASAPSSSSFTFALAVNPGTYATGGTVDGGDLGMVDAAIQGMVVPDGLTALAAAAVNVPINIVATVYLSSRSGITAANAVAAITAALGGGVINGIGVPGYFPTLPIGGLNAEANGIVPWSDLLTTIFNANPGTVSVVLTTPAPSVDTPLTGGEVAVLGFISITVRFS